MAARAQEGWLGLSAADDLEQGRESVTSVRQVVERSEQQDRILLLGWPLESPGSARILASAAAGWAAERARAWSRWSGTGSTRWTA